MSHIHPHTQSHRQANYQLLRQMIIIKCWRHSQFTLGKQKLKKCKWHGWEFFTRWLPTFTHFPRKSSHIHNWLPRNKPLSHVLLKNLFNPPRLRVTSSSHTSPLLTRHTFDLKFHWCAARKNDIISFRWLDRHSISKVPLGLREQWKKKSKTKQ